ncbi:UNVERIFIED_CONTAM: hypothetical protein RMT77_002750 [Armadillidium vulgare]
MRFIISSVVFFGLLIMATECISIMKLYSFLKERISDVAHIKKRQYQRTEDYNNALVEYVHEEDMLYYGDDSDNYEDQNEDGDNYEDQNGDMDYENDEDQSDEDCVREDDLLDEDCDDKDLPDEDCEDEDLPDQDCDNDEDLLDEDCENDEDLSDEDEDHQSDEECENDEDQFDNDEDQFDNDGDNKENHVVVRNNSENQTNGNSYNDSERNEIEIINVDGDSQINGKKMPYHLEL